MTTAVAPQFDWEQFHKDVEEMRKFKQGQKNRTFAMAGILSDMRIVSDRVFELMRNRHEDKLTWAEMALRHRTTKDKIRQEYLRMVKYLQTFDLNKIFAKQREAAIELEKKQKSKRARKKMSEGFLEATKDGLTSTAALR